jgi:hypothetical protein
MFAPKPNLQWTDIPIWVRMVWAVFVLDVVSFYVISIFVGGTAAKLLYRDGKYYLSGFSHVTEVSRSVFLYSVTHLATIGVALALSILGAKRVAAIRRRKGLP